MKYTAQKDVNGLIRALVRSGWEFRRGSKHGQLRPPKGQAMVVVSTTPGDANALAVLRGLVKRVAQARGTARIGEAKFVSKLSQE